MANEYRFAHIASEVVRDGLANADVRIAHIGAEVVRDGPATSALQISHIAVEVVRDGIPFGGNDVQIAHIAIEVVRSIAIASSRRRPLIIANVGASTVFVQEEVLPEPVTGLPSFQPRWENVMLLWHGEGADGSTAFIDRSGFARTITSNGNVQVDTALDLGGACGQFDGDGDFLSLAHTADFQFGQTIDFCIEAAIYLDSIDPTHVECIASKRASSSANEFDFSVASDGRLVFALYGSGVARMSMFSPVGAIVPGVPYHVAVAREGTLGRMFINGIIVDTEVQSGTIGAISEPLRIGRNGYTGGAANERDFNGYINWMRIVKGEVLYNQDFAVPTYPLPMY